MTSQLADLGATGANSDTGQLARSPAPPAPPGRRIVLAIRSSVSSMIGVITGVAPHLLHHVGPLAGAALLTGGAGTALFGVIGLVASFPFLWRLRRRSGGWRAPGVALALFALMFTLSALVIGPAISGGGDRPVVTDEHAGHHPSGN